ncbi:MAG: flagellar basal-body MS-ring/collar protein FliF [Acidimicrobiia bacterium]|nr:flagellar basal-body MS-ring/collar protein FliF [Acidimicrobiia bacterium]
MAAIDLDRIKRQGTRLLSGFTTGQKVVTGIAVLSLVLGGLFFTRWASEPSYGTLYTDLDPADAAEITDRLSSEGVGYRLEDGGRTVLAPRDRIYQLRLDLSADGLPSGGAEGFSLLDKQGITTSEFRQRVDYQRALQGELARTISAIEDVSSASVHLVIPEQDVFSDDAEKPSASVLVKTRSGSSLSSTQVQAVVHLVASSVARMQPEDVTVADTSGRVLSAAGQELGGAGGVHATETAEFETRLASSVQDMLAPVIGPGNAVVRVSAVLDYDARATTTERYQNGLGTEAGVEGQPIAPQPGQESTSTETYTGPASGATGILGPDGTATGSTGETNYEKSETSVQYVYDKVTEQVRTAPGSVERMSVAVILDSEAVDEADVASIQNAVQAAVGFDLDRGDAIQVTRMEFDDSVAEAAEKELAAAEAAKKRSDMMSLIRMVAALLVVAVVLFLAWRSMRKAAKQRVPLRVPLDLRELEAAHSAADGPSLPELTPEAPAMPQLQIPPEQLESARVESEVGELIDRQPDEVAATLRTWLADRRS